MSGQGEFQFDQPAAAQGYEQWQEERRQAVEKLARDLNLPLNHRAEVWLPGGVRLRGILRFQQAPLFLEAAAARQTVLCVEGVTFAPGDIESFVRLD